VKTDFAYESEDAYIAGTVVGQFLLLDEATLKTSGTELPQRLPVAR